MSKNNKYKLDINNINKLYKEKFPYVKIKDVRQSYIQDLTDRYEISWTYNSTAQYGATLPHIVDILVSLSDLLDCDIKELIKEK